MLCEAVTLTLIENSSSSYKNSGCLSVCLVKYFGRFWFGSGGGFSASH